MGAAQSRATTRDPWRGTFIALFQPAEETAADAAAMVDAGLTDLVPRPDVAFAQHVLGDDAGHLRLIASTVGALSAGTTSNVIPDQATLLVNTRVHSEQTQTTVLRATERIVRAEREASDSPKPPTFEYYDQFPLTSNDPATTARVRAAFEQHFGTDRVFTMSPQSASEDFSRIPDAFGTPYTYWGLGGFPAGAQAAPNHSPFFAPVQQPTLTAGAEAAVVAVLAYLATDG